MIYYLLKGHDFKYQIYNLIKVFFSDEDVVNIQSEKDYPGKDILLIVSLIKKENYLHAESKFYLNGNLVKKNSENINTIEIYSNDMEKDIRIGLRKSLFSTLEEVSNIKTSWGILTGIRPIKIIHDLINKGLEDSKIIETLINEYKFTLDKSQLSLDIAKRQRKHIYPINANNYSLYVSIPFCPSKCLYCSFPSLAISKYEDFVEEYTSTLIYEIIEISKLMKGKELNTVYIGGGTPTAIPPDKLEKIIQAIYINLGESKIQEFTVEAGRPDTISLEYLKMLINNKIERISINPQTMNNSTLKLIGRNHSAEDIVRTSYLAKDMGFKSINMDLIVGLPGEGLKEINKSLEQIRFLDPDNLTIHTLAIKTGSRLKSTLEKYPIQNQKILESMMNKTVEYAKEMDLYPYYLYRQKRILGNLENIGYCKKDMECIYNISMMEEKETIIGAGMGAVSKIYFPEEDRIRRLANFKSLNEYINRKDENIIRKHSLVNMK